MKYNDLELLDYDVNEKRESHRPLLDIPSIKPHLDVFSNLYNGEAKAEEEAKIVEEAKITEPVIKPEEIKILNPGTKLEGKEAVQGLIDLFKEEGINVNITSWERPNNTSKAGSKSHHTTGSAIDITPGNGETWESLQSKVKGNKRLYDYLVNNNLGIIDETDPEMLKRTGGTGAHWHFGPD